MEEYSKAFSRLALSMSITSISRFFPSEKSAPRPSFPPHAAANIYSTAAPDTILPIFLITTHYKVTYKYIQNIKPKQPVSLLHSSLRVFVGLWRDRDKTFILPSFTHFYWQNESSYPSFRDEKPRVPHILELNQIHLFTLQARYFVFLSKNARQSQANEKSFGWENNFFLRRFWRRPPLIGRKPSWKWSPERLLKPVFSLFGTFPPTKEWCQNDRLDTLRTYTPPLRLRQERPFVPAPWHKEGMKRLHVAPDTMHEIRVFPYTSATAHE